MGQRTRATAAVATLPDELLVFPTELGYWGVVGQGGKIAQLTLGHPTLAAAEEALCLSRSVRPIPAGEWMTPIRVLLEQYARGEKVDLRQIPVQMPPGTEFQHKVRVATIKIPYGRTLTYAQLAEKAGSPRAARAVGTVMSSNPLPLLVPCHRVVGSNGGLGGYSAPQGISLKVRLLELERGE